MSMYREVLFVCITLIPRQRALGPDTKSLGICPPPFVRNFLEKFEALNRTMTPVLLANFKQKQDN